MQKIYMELVFFDNFMVNLLIIFCASALTKAKKKLLRYILAAVVGGIYACTVFGTNGIAISLGIKAGVSLVMCFIAFYAKKQKGFFKSICAFYVVSFVFAGAIYAVMYSLGETASYGAAIVVRPLLRYILIGLGVGVLLVCAFSKVHKRMLEKESRTVNILLANKDRQITVKAFVDTGNLLKEPISGVGVIFVTEPAATALFNKDTLDIMHNQGSAPTDRLRIIACTTAAGQSVFYGIEIDKAVYNGAWVRVVVCIAKDTLSDGCEAIVGSTIMDELLKGAKNENGIGTKDDGMDCNTPRDRGKRRLYKRQRGASAAPDAAGRGDNASIVGGGGQIGPAHSD